MCARFSTVVLLILFAVLALLPAPAGAADSLDSSMALAKSAGVSDSAVDQVLAQGYRRGVERDTVAGYVDLLIAARDEDLPVDPLAAKIVEGLAKRVPAPSITRAVKSMMDSYRFARTEARDAMARWNKDEALEPVNVQVMGQALAMGLSREDLAAFLEECPEKPMDVVADSAVFMAALQQSGMAPKNTRELTVKGLENGMLEKNGWSLASTMRAAHQMGTPPATMEHMAMQAVNQDMTMPQMQSQLGLTPEAMSAGPQVMGGKSTMHHGGGGVRGFGGLGSMSGPPDGAGHPEAPGGGIGPAGSGPGGHGGRPGGDSGSGGGGHGGGGGGGGGGGHRGADSSLR